MRTGFFLFLLLLGSCATSSTTEPTACSATEVDCTGTCADLRVDARNCGACGVACKAGETCSAGVCGCATKCSGACADTKTDPKNCGACGKTCGAGESCVMGACTSGCPMGQISCNGSCTNPMTDNANCGGCGKPCGAMALCMSGACAACDDAGVNTVCSGVCTDLTSDRANCGMCGKACANNETCAGGACKPPCTPSWLQSNTSWTQNNLTYASEILNSSYNPTNLLDTVLTTRWVTQSTTNQWVIFNFGAPASLSQIRIVNQANYTANAGGKDTVLQKGSGLNGPWTDVTSFQVANQQSSYQMFNFAETSSQYWRLFVKNNWGFPNYIQFMEVGFYGCL